MAYRCNLRLRGNHTQNFVESMFRMVKDVIFQRAKAFNLVQMLDFIVNHLELYFERSLLNIAQSRFE